MSFRFLDTFHTRLNAQPNKQAEQVTKVNWKAKNKNHPSDAMKTLPHCSIYRIETKLL